ncbi:hypothetical protein AXF42_Ash005676 [Apostasia shenzhenica]|uniref:Uncharacterized protein n=1 Tax=Apostasia shenzhenica TaxID=1088818 RepID=A0A2I0BC15_9ASPA|nr:hypothetical protein AXF42_Ash005676 [Apostasia shenzhenica]
MARRRVLLLLKPFDVYAPRTRGRTDSSPFLHRTANSQVPFSIPRILSFFKHLICENAIRASTGLRSILYTNCLNDSR